MLDVLRVHVHLEAIGAKVGQHNSHADSQHGDARRDHSRTNTFNNHRGRTRLSGGRDILGGLVAVGGVVLRSLSDDDACGKTADDAERKAQPVFETQEIQDAESGNGDEHGADVRAEREAAQQVLHRSTLFRANEEDADKAQENPHGSNGHRRDDGVHL